MAGLLARPGFRLPSRSVYYNLPNSGGVSRKHKGLTAAGTAPDLHRIPCSW